MTEPAWQQKLDRDLVLARRLMCSAVTSILAELEVWTEADRRDWVALHNGELSAYWRGVFDGQDRAVEHIRQTYPQAQPIEENHA